MSTEAAGNRRRHRRVDTWEPVWTGPEFSAHVVAGSLEAEGMRTRVHMRPGLPRGAYGASLGAAVCTIAVQRVSAAHARELLRERGERANVIDDSGGETAVRSNLWPTVRLVLLCLAGLAIIGLVVQISERL